MTAEEADRHNADAEDDEPQIVGQGQDDADRHERDGEADDAAPAVAPGKLAGHGRTDRADEIDAVDEADQRRAQRKRRRLQAKADVVVCGDEGAHQEKAHREQVSRAPDR